MTVDVFTISSNNYLGMTRVFADSHLEHHPEANVTVCLVDQIDDRVPYDDFPFDIILAEDLDIPEFRNFAFRYDILELNTAVKPFVFKYLRDVKGLDRAFYFDPDILIHDRLSVLEEALDRHPAVLTPHLTECIDNLCRPPERVIGMCGVYNLGFVGLQLNEATREFLDWWCDRLHRYCIVDLANGMFVDQSWMDFAPAYLEAVAIVRDPIFNIAYWNLPHRKPGHVDNHWEVDGRRVGFFHFSGVDLDNLDVISRHQDRIDLWTRPELRALFESYKMLVDQSGQKKLRDIPYHYGRFAGTEIAIPWIGRIALQETDPKGLRWPDAFATDVEDSFLAWLAEPLPFDGEMINRTALYVWRERTDIGKEFNDLKGFDLRRYIDWYLAGGAVEAGLDNIFVEPLRPVQPPNESALQERELAKAARLDLTQPGGDTPWLNEAVDDIEKPVLTRLGTMIHRTRPDVATLYPDPRGCHRSGFAYWMVLHGAFEYLLHKSLVKPIRESLSAKSSISLTIKGLLRKWRLAGPSTPLKLASPEPERPAEPPPEARVNQEMKRLLSCRPTPGVNLVGYFEGAEGARGFASGIRDALSEAGVPCVSVSLDHDLPDQMTSDRIRHENGAPYPVTLLAIPAEQWVSVLGRLPLGGRLGSHIIGYHSASAATMPEGCAGRVDEVWTPTESLAIRLRESSALPVHVVAPRVDLPADNQEDLESILDPARFWLLAVDHGPGLEDRRSVSAAIECVRHLARDGESRVGLCLAVGPEYHYLRQQLRHLPVRVVAEPLQEKVLDRLLVACDGYLDLCETERIDPILLKARMRAMPVVAAWRDHEREARHPTNMNGADSAPSAEQKGSIEWAIAAVRKMIIERDDALQTAAEMVEATGRAYEGSTAAVEWRKALDRLLRSEGSL
jgi:hypothetical protein